MKPLLPFPGFPACVSSAAGGASPDSPATVDVLASLGRAMCLRLSPSVRSGARQSPKAKATLHVKARRKATPQSTGRG